MLFFRISTPAKKAESMEDQAYGPGRWWSIRVCYIIVGIEAFGFSITAPSLWPFLKEVSLFNNVIITLMLLANLTNTNDAKKMNNY